MGLFKIWSALNTSDEENQCENWRKSDIPCENELCEHLMASKACETNGSLGTILNPYITLGGWVWKMAIFADIQYCIYDDKECVGQKKSKLMLTSYRDGPLDLASTVSLKFTIFYIRHSTLVLLLHL